MESGEQQRAEVEGPDAVVELMAVGAAKGTPLSVRMIWGRPYSLKRRWKCFSVGMVWVES